MLVDYSFIVDIVGLGRSIYVCGREVVGQGILRDTLLLDHTFIVNVVAN